jgi:hypothetical protein
MRNPYETNITEIAQSASEAICACQYTAEQEGVEIIAFALESVRNDVLSMVRATAEREELFKDYISRIAENIGACDCEAWQKDWELFAENGGFKYEQQ